MSAVKYFILLAIVIAVSFKFTDALAEENMNKFQEAFFPYVQECSEKYGVKQENFAEAKKNKNFADIDSCFISCVFKKAEIINGKGMFDPEIASEKGKKFVSKSEDIAIIEAIGKDCISVNDVAVSDGEEGCERSKLLLECFLKHKDKVQM